MSRKYSLLLIIALLVTLSALFHFLTTNISDGDSFYHIRHAWLYRTSGIFDSHFPWLTASMIGTLKADLWYGFHLLLTPFTFFPDLILGIKFAGVLLTAATLFIFFWALKKLNVVYPVLWTLLLFFSTPDLNFRLTMVRPHILTLALSVLILYFLVRRRLLAVFLASAALAFFHLALVWLPILLWGAVTLGDLIVRRKLELKNLAAVLLGSFLGLILRPNFLSAAKLGFIQVVQLMTEKLQKLPLPVGSELKPANDWTMVVFQFMPIIVLVAPAIIALILLILKRRFKDIPESGRLTIIASLVLAIGFGAMTFFIARRSMDLWVSFSLVFIALMFTYFITILKNLFINRRWLFYLAPTIMLFIIPFNTLHFSSIYRRQGFPPNKFKETAMWLLENSEPGAIVFNIQWDNFPLLFFWNQKNYYINGMDPIFEFAYDQNLYWRHYFIDEDKIYIQDGKGYTCGEIRCTAEKVADIYESLKSDFKADYVFLELRRNPKVYDYLIGNPNFQKVFESETKEIIFKVL